MVWIGYLHMCIICAWHLAGDPVEPSEPSAVLAHMCLALGYPTTAPGLAEPWKFPHRQISIEGLREHRDARHGKHGHVLVGTRCQMIIFSCFVTISFKTHVKHVLPQHLKSVSTTSGGRVPWNHRCKQFELQEMTVSHSNPGAHQNKMGILGVWGSRT